MSIVGLENYWTLNLSITIIHLNVIFPFILSYVPIISNHFEYVNPSVNSNTEMSTIPVSHFPFPWENGRYIYIPHLPFPPFRLIDIQLPYSYIVLIVMQ